MTKSIRVTPTIIGTVVLQHLHTIIAPDPAARVPPARFPPFLIPIPIPTLLRPRDNPPPSTSSSEGGRWRAFNAVAREAEGPLAAQALLASVGFRQHAFSPLALLQTPFSVPSSPPCPFLCRRFASPFLSKRLASEATLKIFFHRLGTCLFDALAPSTAPHAAYGSVLSRILPSPPSSPSPLEPFPATFQKND